MAKEKSLVEEAIIQMKNLEEAVAENAKGILASTMKEEIKELVKESLTEQDDEIEVDTDMEEPEMEEPEMGDDEEGDDMDVDNMDDMGDDEEDTIDLTDVDDDDEILRVFSLMGPEDNIVVTKDEAGNINLKDTEKEYMIVGEGEDAEFSDLEEEWNEEYNEDIDAIVSKVFGDEDGEDYEEEKLDEYFFYDSQSTDDEDYEEEEGEEDLEFGEYDEEFDGDGGEGDMGVPEMEEEDTELVYEIEFDVEEGEGVEFDSDELEEEYSDVEEQYDEDPMMESKMSIKPKGVGMGSPNKKIYSNKPNMEGGFKTVKKKVNKTMGTGKAKFEYKEGENLEGEFKPVKKVEAREASRTYGNGSKHGRGLRKAKTPNRNLTFESTVNEVQVLREKNEEYRKALNVFRNKLNEVAVFNSNLAYATRLFTEHSTSKQEKINILRRFDSVETLKESKNLYRVIKDELSVKTSQPMNESFERKIENVQNTGSSVNLIESKTYENPQFLRMKDLMAKIK